MIMVSMLQGGAPRSMETVLLGIPEPYVVAHHLILSHAVAVQRYREKYEEWSCFLLFSVFFFTSSI